jgi:hypothetical protein
VLLADCPVDEKVHMRRTRTMTLKNCSVLKSAVTSLHPLFPGLERTSQEGQRLVSVADGFMAGKRDKRKMRVWKRTLSEGNPSRVTGAYAQCAVFALVRITMQVNV